MLFGPQVLSKGVCRAAFFCCSGRSDLHPCSRRRRDDNGFSSNLIQALASTAREDYNPLLREFIGDFDFHVAEKQVADIFLEHHHLGITAEDAFEHFHGSA